MILYMGDANQLGNKREPLIYRTIDVRFYNFDAIFNNYEKIRGRSPKYKSQNRQLDLYNFYCMFRYIFKWFLISVPSFRLVMDK